MSAAAASRGSRRFVAAGVGFLLVWQAAALAGLPRTAQAVLGVHGFVVHVLLGKALALVPSYFDRELAVPNVARVALPATAAGALGLAFATSGYSTSTWLAGASAALWALGVLAAVAALAWTVRDNLTGAETATSDANADRRDVDRAANAVMPVALAYLAAGAYETVAVTTGPRTLGTRLPALAGHGLPAAVHLLAVGGAVTLLLAVGFRLLPRFLVASPPRALVWTVLPAGALGPALLVAGFGGGPRFRVGALLEAYAVLGFAASYLVLFARTDRDRVGFSGVLAAVLSGAAGVLVGFAFAFDWLPPAGLAVLAHLRLNVLGLLGLAIVGVTYQFYPPTVGVFPGSDDRTALASIACLAGGLWVEAGARLLGVGAVALAGTAASALGAALFAYLVASALRARAARA